MYWSVLFLFVVALIAVSDVLVVAVVIRKSTWKPIVQATLLLNNIISRVNIYILTHTHTHTNERASARDQLTYTTRDYVCIWVLCHTSSLIPHKHTHCFFLTHSFLFLPHSQREWSILHSLKSLETIHTYIFQICNRFNLFYTHSQTHYSANNKK